MRKNDTLRGSMSHYCDVFFCIIENEKMNDDVDLFLNF